MVNFGNSWWHQQQKKSAEDAAEKNLIPKICDLCGTKIEEDDYYYLGFDSHMIYAATCTHHYCVQWLKWKIMRRKR